METSDDRRLASWTLRELADYASQEAEFKPDLAVVAWRNEPDRVTPRGVPVELQGRAILAVVEPDGRVTDLIEPADLLSNINDEGYSIDVETGEYWTADPDADD